MHTPRKAQAALVTGGKSGFGLGTARERVGAGAGSAYRTGQTFVVNGRCAIF